MERNDIFSSNRQLFKELRDKNNTLKEIANVLNVSIRTTIRWNKLLLQNKLSLTHGLKGKKPNFKSTIKEEEILQEYLDSAKLVTKDKKAEPYNFSYFVKNKLTNKCSLSTFRKIMKDNLIASPWARKSTKKAYNKILKEKNKELKSKEVNNLIKEITEINKKVYFRKARVRNEGLIQEIDASKDYWLGNKYSHLYVSYDPATRKILAIHLEKEETTKGYFHILNKLIRDNKLPQKFKADCRSSFVINKKDAGAMAHKDVNTQYGFVLNALNVKSENSSEPTFKGGVERFFRTSQNPLKAEFREKNITTFEEANIYLENYRIWYNKQYGIEPIEKEPKFIKTNFSEEQINELLSIRTFRKTDKGNSISYKNTLYSLYNLNNQRLQFKEKSAILILKTFNNQIIAKFHNEKIKLVKTKFDNFTHSQKEQYLNRKIVKPNFSAPDYHPWGYKVFILYLHNSKNLRRYLKK